MRSRVRIALFAILFTGFTYVSATSPTLNTLNEGDDLTIAVITYDDEVTACYLKSPRGERINFIPNDESDEKFQLLPGRDLINCRAIINNVNENDIGVWTLTSEAKSGIIRRQQHDLSVNSPQEAPILNIWRNIEYMDDQNVTSVMGSDYKIYIPEPIFGVINMCLIITPTGRSFSLSDLNLPYVKILSNAQGDGCSVRVNVATEDAVGRWILISKGMQYSDEMQTRLRFTINVEEIVDASITEVNVVKGNDLYVRLKYPINNPSTCRLLGPDGTVFNDHENDTRYEYQCGFIVRNVKSEHSGKWEILFGNVVISRARIIVFVHDAPSEDSTHLVWTKDRPVNDTFGPENATYCKVEDANKVIYYDGFGRCRINLDRAMSAHSGVWTMQVGLPGHVLTQESKFTVTVVEAPPKTTVTTKVVEERPTVSISCSVASPHPIRSCKFRDPSGRVLIAAEGVGESRYSWHGSGVNYTSGMHAHDCGLQITNPVVRDNGIWRCAIETEGEVYYGFLTVWSPWVLRDPEDAAGIIRRPLLRTNVDWVTSLTEDSVTMSCFIQAPIRYCYFRARNGTVFNVGPSNSHDFATYVGAGFDAGECGIRFPSLAVTDSGAWSCHVGLLDSQALEQRVRIDVSIQDSMVVSQRMDRNWLVLEAQVYNRRALDYCRFVRIDGFGFTEENVPSNYINRSDLSMGRCGITITEPSILEMHPWTIVARIRGQDIELSRSTDHALEIPDLPGGGGSGPGRVPYRLPRFWIVMMCLGISLIILAAFVGPKKNRQWTYSRAAAVRNSFTRKTVEQAANEKSNNTAVAA